MHDLAPLIFDLTIMLGVAGIVVLLFQRIKQPVVLGYLVAGMIIGPQMQEFVLVSDIPNIKILSELGVIFLMFSLGLEFSFHKLTRVGIPAFITGLIDVSFMICLGYVAGLLMKWSPMNCLFLGTTLAISSTTIIFKAVGELGLKTKRFAEVIFGVLVMEDLLAILLLVALSTIVVNKNLSSLTLLLAAVKLVLVVGAWFIVGYFVVPSLFRGVASYISQETLTIISVALCLFLVSVAAYFHYSTALGAFIMGSILAETVLIHRIEELIVPIRDIFGAIFFISVGMLINVPMLVVHWPAILFITLVLIFGKVFIVSLGTFLTGQSIKTSVRAGFGMAQIGEFSFIIATLGLSLNVINDSLYPIIVAVSSLTTFTTPYMIRLSGHIGKILERKLPNRVKYFLDSYSTWVYRVQTRSGQNSLLRSVTMRVIVNGLIVAIIFILIDKYIYPEICNLVDRRRTAKLLSEALAIGISTPFVWGMLFSYKLADLPEYTKTTLNPIVFLIWLLTLAEISVFSIVLFHTWAITGLLLLLALCFLAIAYQQLEKSYHWFEGQLVGNIKKRPSKPSRNKELAPWDTHFVEMEVGDKSPFIDKMLGECHIRQHYGVNIVAIRRGHHTILSPRGEEYIRDNDKLFVLGNDEQIDHFQKKVTLSTPDQDTIDHLENFILKPILLENENPLIGKTIRASRIRENLQGLVVGIERGNQRMLNPAPETVLERDDLVLVVKVKKSENVGLSS